jgi:hypothetical protein
MRREHAGGLEGANMEVCDWKAIPLGDVAIEKTLRGLFCFIKKKARGAIKILEALCNRRFLARPD